VGSARIGPRMMAASRTCVCFGPGHGLTPRTPLSSPITALPTKPHALWIGTLSPSGCRCEPQVVRRRATIKPSGKRFFSVYYAIALERDCFTPNAGFKRFKTHRPRLPFVVG
jgi:hypothetical protein